MGWGNVPECQSVGVSARRFAVSPFHAFADSSSLSSLRDLPYGAVEIGLRGADGGVAKLVIRRQHAGIGLLRHRFDEPEKYLAADAVGLDSARAVLADLAARELRGFGFDERDRPR